MSGRAINLDAVVELIHEQGVWAYVEMTGGGCATIFAGARHIIPDGDRPPGADDDGADGKYDRTMYAAVAGPGTYGWGQRPSTGHTDEFFIGADDQGESNPADCSKLGITPCDHELAALIVAQTQLPLGKSLDETQALDIILQRSTPLADAEALDLLAEVMNRPEPWNDRNACTIVARTLKATGRKLNYLKEV